jgi:hypothetical protein
MSPSRSSIGRFIPWPPLYKISFPVLLPSSVLLPPPSPPQPGLTLSLALPLSSMASNSIVKPSIVFWNCRGLRRHLISGTLQALINPILTPPPPSIVVLVETHWSATIPYHRTSTTQLPSLPHYSWVYHHQTNRSGGLAVLYHNSIACLTMASLNDQCNPISSKADSASAVMWQTMRFPNTSPFLLGVGYITPQDHENHGLAAQAMCDAMKQATALALPMLLVGDFNLRHPDWLDFNRPGHSVPPQLFASHIAASSFVHPQRNTHARPLHKTSGQRRPAHRVHH